MQANDSVGLQKATEKLLESETKFQAIFDLSRDGILLIDIETKKFTLANKTICQQLGYSAEEIKTLGVEDIHPKEALPDVLNQFQQLLQKEITTAKDVPVKRKDGTVFYVDIASAPIIIDKKKMLIGYFHDITEQRYAKEALQKSEKELNEAQRLGKIGNWSWDIATDIIVWSKEYYRLIGLDSTQKPPGYEEHLKAYTPESAARLDAAVKKEMQTGEPYELDLEFANPKGLTRWITARSETIHDNKGKIVGLRGTAQDITEQKKAEESVKASELKYSTLVEKGNDGILIIHDEGGVLAYVNSIICKMTGFTKEESIGTPFLKYLSPEYKKIVAERYAKRVTGEDVPSKYEIEIISKEGQKTPVEINASRIEYEGKPAVMAIVRDITERKKMEEEKLTQMQKMEKLNKWMIDRELKMVELKKQIQELQNKQS